MKSMRRAWTIASFLIVLILVFALAPAFASTTVASGDKDGGSPWIFVVVGVMLVTMPIFYARSRRNRSPGAQTHRSGSHYAFEINVNDYVIAPRAAPMARSGPIGS
jgi:hypothetical protein